MIKMNHFPFILSFLAGTFFVSCNTNKSLSEKAVKKGNSVSLIAWNEDTLQRYQIALTKSNEFLYTIIRRDSVKSEKYYRGTFSYHPSADTIFLKYKKNSQPEGATNFLIREASGGYLIQIFENSAKRIFLRIQR